ncbi:MAG: ABC transporter permease [Anaerolineales bacterium]|nr:ABC transporter permease [Anaerolineales bacterium]
MTRKTWTIARHEYLVNVRRGGFIFATLIIPALGLIGVIVAAFFGGETISFLDEQFSGATQKVGVVDRSGLFADVPADFSDDFVLYPDESAARIDLLDSRLAGFVVVPADFAAGGTPQAYVRSEGGLSSTIAVESGRLTRFLIRGLLAAQVDPTRLDQVERLLQDDLNPVALDAEGQPTTADSSAIFSAGAGFIISFAVALLLFISIFTSAGYLLRSVGEEKENRVMEVVLSSVTAVDLLAGKVIGLGALGLTQVGVWLLSGVLITGGLGAMAAAATAALNPGILILALVYFVLGYLMFGTLMATAGSLGTSMRESQQIAGIFSFMAAIPWMINGLVFANPNFIVARVLSWFPLTAPMMMMIRLPHGDIPVEDIVISLVGLLITVPVVVWGGAKIFRTSLLMYGKRMSVKEIWGTLRAA